MDKSSILFNDIYDIDIYTKIAVIKINIFIHEISIIICW